MKLYILQVLTHVNDMDVFESGQRKVLQNVTS